MSHAPSAPRVVLRAVYFFQFVACRILKGGEFRNRSLKKRACVRFLCVVQRGGVYFFGASIFCVCIFSGGENIIFFLYSIYLRFIFASQICNI